jgi:hypothetical protein
MLGVYIVIGFVFILGLITFLKEWAHIKYMARPLTEKEKYHRTQHILYEWVKVKYGIEYAQKLYIHIRIHYGDKYHEGFRFGIDQFD